jgi:hypothetical protein
MENNKQVEKWMSEWIDRINEQASPVDRWVKTPFGNIKNPKFIPSEDGDNDSEFNITLSFDEFDDSEDSE